MILYFLCVYMTIVQTIQLKTRKIDNFLKIYSIKKHISFEKTLKSFILQVIIDPIISSNIIL